MARDKTGTKLGVAAATIAVVTTWYWFYLVDEVALPSDRSLFVVLFLLAAALGVLALVKRTSWFGAAPALLAIAIGLFFPVTMSVSEQIVARDTVIEVGDTVPRFTSIDGSGNAFDSGVLSGHLVLIKFFRAHW